MSPGVGALLSPVQLVDTLHLEGCIDTVFSQQPYEIATKTSGAELNYFLNSRKGLNECPQNNIKMKMVMEELM